MWGPDARPGDGTMRRLGIWQAHTAVTRTLPRALQVQLLPDALTTGPLVYRPMTPASHAGKRGSTPLRATGIDQVVEQADTQRSER